MVKHFFYSCFSVRYPAVLVVVILLISGCEWSPHTIDKDYYNQNFDDLHAWHKNAELSGGNVHSGVYCTYANSLYPVSQTFEMDMKLAYYLGYKKLEISAWVMRPSEDASGFLIASVSTVDSTIVKINQADLSKQVSRTEVWMKVELSIELPKALPDNNRIRVFLWSPDGDRIYMDDISIHGIR